MQGCHIEIRHIPGKVNLADDLTRQIKGDDIEYVGQMKRQDQYWVETARVSSSATDENIQMKLRQLYNKTKLREKEEQIHNQLMIEMNEESNAVLSIAEIQIITDAEMRRRMTHALRNEEIYGSIIEELEDPMWGNERTINERKYRTKNRILKIHEMRQPTDYSYWRTIVPDDQGIKLELLREIRCGPDSGHPGFTRTLEVMRGFFIGNI